MLPVLANVHLALIRKSRISIYLQASGGMAYTQGIHRYEGRSVVDQDKHGLYGITAILFSCPTRTPVPISASAIST